VGGFSSGETELFLSEKEVVLKGKEQIRRAGQGCFQKNKRQGTIWNARNVGRHLDGAVQTWPRQKADQSQRKFANRGRDPKSFSIPFNSRKKARKQRAVAQQKAGEGPLGSQARKKRGVNSGDRSRLEKKGQGETEACRGKGAILMRACPAIGKKGGGNRPADVNIFCSGNN